MRVGHSEAGGNLEQSDNDLVRAVAAGDEHALRRIIDRHGAKLRAVAAQFLDAGAADDAVQDAFIRLWRHAGRFDPAKATLSTWLYRIVVNRCIDLRRQRLRWLWSAIGEEDDLPSPDISAERVLEGVETLRSAAAVIAHLPERQRMALLLVTVGERSAEDVGGLLGVSRGAAEQLIARARRNVRAALKESSHGST